MKRKFRPKWSRDCNLLARVVTGVLPTPEGLLERQRMTELQAIEAFAKGYATPDDFRVMADVLNVAETFALSGVGPEVLKVCECAQRELIAAKERFDRIGKLGLTAAGLNWLRELYAYADLQRTSVDWATYERIIVKTANRIRSAHPDVKELA